jgi:hypothetical protein
LRCRPQDARASPVRPSEITGLTNCREQQRPTGPPARSARPAPPAL